MKRLVVWFIVGAICLAAAFGEAQQPSGDAKTSAWARPDQECKAIEQYIAKIDAARSIRERERREDKYLTAQLALKTAVSNRRDFASLIAEASEYASYTEQVATADPTDSKLSDILDKRLRLRSALLERCMDYTTTR